MNLGCSGVNEPMGLVVGSARSKGAGSGHLPLGQRTQQSNLSLALCFSSQLNQTLGWKGCWNLNACLSPQPHLLVAFILERGWLTEDPEVPARPVWAPPPSSSPLLSLGGTWAAAVGFPLSPYNMGLFSWQQQLLGSLPWFGICFPKLEGEK